MKVKKAGAFVDLAPDVVSGLGVVVGGGTPATPTRVGYTVFGDGAINPAKPAGVISGDLLLLVMYGGNAADLTPPDGTWTKLYKLAGAGGESGYAIHIWYKIATGSEPSNYAFGNAAPNYNAGALFAYRNVTLPLSPQGSTIFSNINAPANSFIMDIAGQISGSWSAANGFTKIFEQDSGSGMSAAVAEKYFADATTVGGGLTGGIAAAARFIIPAAAATAHVLALTDASKVVTLAPDTLGTITIPTDASVAFPVGTVIYARKVGGTANVQISAAGGVSLLGGTPVLTSSQREVALHKVAANTWVALWSQSVFEKGVANGYASLGSDAKIPSAQLPTIVPSTTLFFDDAGVAAASLTGVAPVVGAVYGAPISTNNPMARSGGKIVGSVGSGGANSQILGVTKTDDYYFHAKMVRSTANPLVLIFRYQDVNNYYQLQIVPTGFSLWKRSGGSNTLIYDYTYAWTDNDDIGIAVFAGTGNNRDMAIVVNDVIHKIMTNDIQNTSTGLALMLGANWGQTFDDVTVEKVPAKLQAQYEATVLKKNTQTGTTYTFLDSDIGKIVEFDNASAISATIPPISSTFNPPIDAVIDLAQLGAGQVTLVQGAGVTIISSDSKKKLYGQYTGGSLRHRANNVWHLVGDLVS